MWDEYLSSMRKGVIAIASDRSCMPSFESVGIFCLQQPYRRDTVVDPLRHVDKNVPSAITAWFMCGVASLTIDVCLQLIVVEDLSALTLGKHRSLNLEGSAATWSAHNSSTL